MSASRQRLRFESALVTGASGFIGRALTRRLSDGGVGVTCVGRQGVAPDDGPAWVFGDLADPAFARTLVESTRADVVFHLASAVTGSCAMQVVRPTFTANLVTSVNLLEAVTETGCDRIVLMGSMNEPTGDEAPCSPYAAAKWAATGYARMFHSLYATPVTTARTFMVYGPDQPDESKLVPYVITTLLRGEHPKLMSGNRVCDWIYVDDVVDALVAVASSSECVGRVVDVGSGRSASVREVVDTIGALVGNGVEPAWGTVADRQPEPRVVADVIATEALCGWSPSVDLPNGLARTVAWYAARHP